MHIILPSIHFILLQEKSQPNVSVCQRNMGDGDSWGWARCCIYNTTQLKNVTGDSVAVHKQPALFFSLSSSGPFFTQLA